MAIGQTRSRLAVRTLLMAATLLGLSAMVALPLMAHDGTMSSMAQRRGAVYAGLIPSTDGACAGRFAIRAPGRTLCTHGPDLAPESVDVTDARRPLDQLGTQGVATSGGSQGVQCVGDGVSGTRIQAIYAVAADRPDRYGTVAPLIRGYAAQMDADVAASAAETGGTRHLAFVTNPDCSLNVAHVVVSAAGDDDLGITIGELAALGYDQPGRKYHIWMDANLYCGIGTVANDDSHGPGNANETAVSYSRSDAGCWGYAELHEVFHNLGGVQLSAPHSSGSWHCTDESDRLCYDDGGGDVMTQPCPSSHEHLLDCGHDDYFHTNPVAGSYLATHWNTADSSFLWEDEARQVPVAPANDSFASAMSMSHLPIAAVVDTRAATTESGEPVLPTDCDVRPSGTVWFRYSPKGDGDLVATTRGTAFRTVVAVYRGPSFDRLTFLGCSDGSDTTRAKVRLSGKAQKRYWFQVGGYGAKAGELHFTLTRP